MTMRPMCRRPIRLATTIALGTCLLLGATACGDDAAGEAGDVEPAEDVSTLAALLVDVGAGCTLEYEGLADRQRELSVCTLDGEIAELSVWDDPTSIATLRAAAEESGDPIVAGPNWTIDVADPELAAEIAEATGGVVHP
jgi:hypothetical protein